MREAPLSGKALAEAALTAAMTTLATKLAEWLVDEIKSRRRSDSK